ncbi:MAG: hypothetical protein HC778_05775 [Chamaesiphon sp. CSU_1_12]|nr:hypothetical protein [Chamaesiphon sp. CSU_1_12]
MPIGIYLIGDLASTALVEIGLRSTIELKDEYTDSSSGSILKFTVADRMKITG